MSTKTLRKRIALVAVSALGAGLLSSVVVTPSANAAFGTNITTAANQLSPATLASTSGSVVVPSFASTLSSAATAASVGVLAHNGGIGTTQTATMLNTGSMVLYVGTPSATGSIVVSGGKLSGATGSVSSVSASQEVLITGTASSVGVVFTPNSGVTSALASYYYANGTSTPSASSPTNGTLAGQISITVTTTSKSGVLSVADSYAKASSTTTGAVSSAIASSADAVTTFANGGSAFIGYSLYDGYAAAYTANVVEASATNGVIAAYNATPGTTSTSNAVTTSSQKGEFVFTQGAANTNKPVTSVVTIKADGVVVATKTLTWTGDVAKITVSDVLISDLGTAATTTTGLNSQGKYSNIRAGASFKLYDSAGNWINEPSSYAVAPDSATYDSVVSAVAVTASSATSETKGLVTWTCTTSSTGGTKNVSIYTYNAAMQKISASFDARCAGDIDTFKVSTDKSTYAPGEIISVTITGYDVKGNLANDRHYIGTGLSSSTTSNNTVASGAFATGGEVAAPGNYDALTDGKITYKYVATQTEGTYTISVTVPVNASGQGATTVPVTIKSTSGAISNTEVLAAIVKLIASINKQISALQKLITKKK